MSLRRWAINLKRRSLTAKGSLSGVLLKRFITWRKSSRVMDAPWVLAFRSSGRPYALKVLVQMDPENRHRKRLEKAVGGMRR